MSPLEHPALRRNVIIFQNILCGLKLHEVIWKSRGQRAATKVTISSFYLMGFCYSRRLRDSVDSVRLSLPPSFDIPSY